MTRSLRPESERSRRRQPWPTWLFTASLALLVLVLWSPVAHRIPPGVPNQLPWLALALGFAIGRVAAIRFEFSGEAHAATLSEVPLLVGLVFTSPQRLLLAALVGSAASTVWRRQPLIKVAFNLTTGVLETAVAAVCFSAVLGSASVLSGRGWLAAFVAVPAASLVSAICVQVVIALSIGRFDRSKLKSLSVVLAGIAVVNIAVGRLAVALLWVDRVAILPLVGLALVIVLGYREFSGLRRRHTDLEQVYRFSRAVEGLVEADDVIDAVLSEARGLLRSARAELALQGPAGEVRYSMRNDAPMVRTAGAGAHPFQGPVARGSGGVLAPRGTSDPGLSRALAASGYRDAVAAQVVGDDGLTATLVVGDRQSDVMTFERADVDLLQALANHTAMALRSSQLLDRLRKEVAAKDFQALHDALTGLGNRVLFTEEIEAALGRLSGHDVVAVMVMDLDRFKEVNDTLGHHTGDEMLQQIAAQLLSAVGERGTVARLGGDEFAFVVPASSAAAVVPVAADILTAGQATVLVEGLRLEVRASLGVALAPEHGTDRSTLLRRADIAMYHAKTNGTGIETYQPGRDPHNTRRLVLASELRVALETSALELSYQPKAEILSGEISGVEALVRWTHPQYGPVPPDEFIPLAEQSGLIRPLTLWALETGLRHLGGWLREGFDLTLAVNLSPRSVFDAELADELHRLLIDTGVPPEALTLEITESTIFADRPQGQTVVDHLAQIGVRLAIDDFGTGYSSLSRLSQLPVHEIKVDKSFVTDMLIDESHDAIVRSTIDLARNLKLRSVAEGVEDHATWLRLGQLGCDGGQGFYLSRPLPGCELIGWLRTHKRRHLAMVPPVRRLAR